jgi:iron complex transport system permease protein
MNEKKIQTDSYDILKRRLRYETVFVLLIAAFCVITVLNINIGSVPISVREIARIIFLRDGDPTQMKIVWNIRLPRIITAAVLGGGLSLSGFLLQTFFGNPIAGPFVLGISSGAKLTVALTMIYALQMTGKVSSLTLVLAAFAGAMISTGFILAVSSKLRNMSALLVAGIMIGYICSAITDFVVTFAEESDIVNLHNWSLGSFSGMDWGSVKMACVIVGIASVLSFLLSKSIGAYQLGENYARSMGVNVKLFRTALILLSSVLSATVTAFAGPISFVGIAVPHLMKRALNSSKPIVVIPACFLGGGVFCMFCDLIARTAFAPSELNISTVTSIFGAPVVIAIMIRRQKEKQ